MGRNYSKTTYDWSTYKWATVIWFSDYYNGHWEETLTKYCTISDYGIVDNNVVLDKADDAAAVNMGGLWRMPTYGELKELKTECTWTWTTLNGVNGYNVEGPNGNSIFLPAAGYHYGGSDLEDTGLLGTYWSNSLNTDSSDYAYILYFGFNDVGNVNARICGQSVRGFLR